MRDLLERWQAVHDTVPGVNPFGSERRYARLSRAPDVAEGYWRVIHSGYIEGWKAHPDKAHGQWDILAATVEAIEARGWAFDLMTSTQEQHYQHGELVRRGESGYDAQVYSGLGSKRLLAFAGSTEHRTMSPAAALLSAYLNAIEAA